MPGTPEYNTPNLIFSSEKLTTTQSENSYSTGEDRKRKFQLDDSKITANKRVMSLERVQSFTSSHADEDAVDTNLYSRQIGTYGLDTMGKLIKLKILVWGLNGPGLEAAKNLLLAGPHTVAICDDTSVVMQDFAYNFFLTENDVYAQKTRSSVVKNKLAELNDYVIVQTISEADVMKEDVLVQFDVIILSGLPLDTQLAVNNLCRSFQKKIGFISINNFGLSCSVFVDFSPNFIVYDESGETYKPAIVEGITQENPGVVHLNEEKHCQFATGDYVTFREIEGMVELNNAPPMEITVTGPYSFTIGNTLGFSPYLRQGLVTRVNMPKYVDFLSLQEALMTPVPANEPSLLQPDLAKPNQAEQLFFVFQSLFEYERKHKKLPDLNDMSAVDECFEYATRLNEEAKARCVKDRDWKTQATAVSVDSINKDLIKKIVPYAQCDISPIASFIGGIAAQEAVKITGKFKPLHQFLFFDSTELLLDKYAPKKQLNGSRYDYYTALWGEDFQKKLGQLNLFLVGAGALGCELIKGISLMGCSTRSEGGEITMTDMDSVEISNLSRQFLFRRYHVGLSKSKVAANSAQNINTDLNVIPSELRVGTETEDQFDDKFWNKLNIVINALDNINSRLYIDSCCVWFEKPLVDSGTLGTKANTQVVLPFRTQSYADSRDPPEDSIPLCTLRHFPNQIEHTIEWARDCFQGLFCDAARETQLYISDPVKYLAAISNEGSICVQRTRLEQILKLLKLLTENYSVEHCVYQAVNYFTDYFHFNIAQLLHNFPLDHVVSNGQLFWSGPKRAPRPIIFDPDDPLHIQFVRAATNLFLFNIGLPQVQEITRIKEIAKKVKPKVFTPKSFRFKINEDDQVIEGSGNDEFAVESIKKELAQISSSANVNDLINKIKTIEFEKDDDSNYHVEFIHTCANLRADNYRIPKCEFHTTKMIAGKIIPAIATTTAMITGLVLIELIKVVTEKERQLEDFKNAFICIGNQFYCMTEPSPPIKTKSKDYDPIACGPIIAQPPEFTTWDKLELIMPNATVQDLLNCLKDKHNVEVSVLSMGSICVYNGYVKAHRNRLNQHVKELIESILKKPLPKGRKYVALEASCSNSEGIDVIIPTIKLVL